MRALLRILACILALAYTSAARADYPERPIRLIVPLSAGGSEEGKDAAKKADGATEGRYLLVSVGFDPTLVPEPPKPKEEPVVPGHLPLHGSPPPVPRERRRPWDVIRGCFGR